MIKYSSFRQSWLQLASVSAVFAMSGFVFSMTEVAMRMERITTYDFLLPIYVVKVTLVFYILGCMCFIAVKAIYKIRPLNNGISLELLVIATLVFVVITYFFNVSGHHNYIKEEYGNSGSIVDNIIVQAAIVLFSIVVYCVLSLLKGKRIMAGIFVLWICLAILLSYLDTEYLGGGLGKAYESTSKAQIGLLFYLVAVHSIVLICIGKWMLNDFELAGFLTYLVIAVFQANLPIPIIVFCYGMLGMWFVVRQRRKKVKKNIHVVVGLIFIIGLGLTHKYLFGDVFQYRVLFADASNDLVGSTWWLQAFLAPAVKLSVLLIVLKIAFPKYNGTDYGKCYFSAKEICVPVFAAVFLFAISSQIVFGNKGWLGSLTSVSNNYLPANTPNIILITWDTVRQDHLSVYGYSRKTTPNLEKFAEKACLYRNFYAATGLTLPSHASAFTGMLPYIHGVQDHRTKFRLSSQNQTLAEVLREKGFVTAAISAHPSIHSANLTEGFGFVLDGKTNTDLYMLESLIFCPQNNRLKSLLEKLPWYKSNWHLFPANAEQVTRKTSSWLDMNNRKAFFLFINYLDAHAPYTPAGKYVDYYDNKTIDIKYNEYPNDVKESINNYDAEITYLDHHQGRLLQKLKQLGLYDNSLIIIQGDHGEAFGEHDFFQHGPFLYNEVLHVPMLIKYPRQDTAGICDRLASHPDIFPTVLATLGYEISDKIQGKSLYSIDPHRSIINEGYLMDENGRSKARRSLIKYPFKMMAEPDGSLKLYNFADDRDELNDLSVEKRNIALEMNDSLRKILNDIDSLKITPIIGAWNLSDQVVEQLKALGYVK